MKLKIQRNCKKIQVLHLRYLFQSYISSFFFCGGGGLSSRSSEIKYSRIDGVQNDICPIYRYFLDGKSSCLRIFESITLKNENITDERRIDFNIFFNIYI